jgi:hypothetical protein
MARDEQTTRSKINMRIGNYTAEIEPGTEDESGYVTMKMTEGRSPFKLKLTNHADRKSKVNVRIHGIDQGIWVLMPHQAASLERPVHLAEKFCAYTVGSEGANYAMPSVQRSRADVGEAGVGTEGASQQTFQTVDDFETDGNESVTINLRIVTSKTTPRPLSSALSNPIPPAI